MLTGRNADSLHAVGVAKIAGFETEISLAHARRYVAVEAIDHKGCGPRQVAAA